MVFGFRGLAMNEKWLPVVGYEELYLVSNLGRVMRIASDTSRTKRPIARLKTRQAAETDSPSEIPSSDSI
jgi:NUMOD4 motif